MEQFLEALKQQYNEEDIIKGQALLEDIIDITNDGVAGIISANLFYALMSDELMAFERELESVTKIERIICLSE